MKTFELNEEPEDMIEVRKKPVVVHAKQINEPFRVKSLEGDYAVGKPGDFLMKGVRGENYICDKDIFFETYDIVDGKEGEITEKILGSRR